MEQKVLITQDYNVGTGTTNYAPLFNMKKKFLGNPSWHRNQLVFELIHASSLSNVIVKRYFVSIYESDVSASTILFKDLSPVFSGITCVYVDNGNDVTVYAKGSLAGANIRLRVIFSPNPGWIQFYNYQAFSNTLSGLTTISPTSDDMDILPTWANSWTPISGYFNRVKKTNNNVVLNISVTGGGRADGTSVGKLPTGCRPSSTLHGSCIYKNSDGTTYGMGKIQITNFGDILIYGVPSGTLELCINLAFAV